MSSPEHPLVRVQCDNCGTISYAQWDEDIRDGDRCATCGSEHTHVTEDDRDPPDTDN